MAKQALVQVRMDPKLKEDVEQLYKNMGTSFTEAVRIFAAQSVAMNAMPFEIKMHGNRKAGMFEGKFDIPDDIDIDNEEITKEFEADFEI